MGWWRCVCVGGEGVHRRWGGEGVDFMIKEASDLGDKWQNRWLETFPR